MPDEGVFLLRASPLSLFALSVSDARPGPDEQVGADRGAHFQISLARKSGDSVERFAAESKGR